MRVLRLLLPLCAACDPARGDWVGHCDWTGGAGVEHEQELRLDLGAADGAGMGAGTGRAVEQGDRRGGEVLFEIGVADGAGADRDPSGRPAAVRAFALDLYLPEGDLVLLRGEVDEDGRASGRCGSPRVEEFQLDALIDCVLEIDPSCDPQARWEPDGVELAPVERRDLDGAFVLRRQ